jgi:cell division protein FtsI (penicillin-binding protein 3)
MQLSSARKKSMQPGARQIGMPRWRYLVVAFGLLTLPVAALWQIANLQVMPDVDKGFEFLKDQGDARMVRTEEIPGYRGVITDRRGEPLAVSTPVLSIYADPQVFSATEDNFVPLARALGIKPQALTRRVAAYRNKEFMYLSRRITPSKADAILALGIPGIYQKTEYKRYYPAGEVAAQLVGFTDIDDAGQEGVELAFDEQLAGRPGARQVLKDRKGHVIKNLQLVRSEKPGSKLTLSIDLRLQYAAYRELKAAITHFRAASGSVVILDVLTGEVLAMVNQPSFNPNDRSRLDTNAMRNRAMTDLLEPGSVMKPLTMVAALESGKFRPDTVIDTSPGHFRVGRKTFVDHRNYGALDLTGILKKSSQVGTTKVAMDLEPEAIRGVFERVGLGESAGTGFPGEAIGLLPNKQRWRPVERATLAFGYGIAITPLQLAQAYGVLANNGLKRPVSLLKIKSTDADELSNPDRVIEPDIAINVREMMKAVIGKGGTGTRAAIAGYDVAGKTGTSHKVGASGYQQDRYVSLFAGIVPADEPRLVTVVVIDDPRSEKYYGGLVAAPVFSKVTAEALRFLNIPPAIPAKARVAADIKVKNGGLVSQSMSSQEIAPQGAAKSVKIAPARSGAT